MSYSDLLDRMKRNDTEAFLEMTDRYGWSVYSAIREKYSDNTVVDKIYNETMNGFYHSLSNSTTEDPLEALLCAFADHIIPEELISNRILTKEENNPHTIQLRHSELPAKNSQVAVQKKNGFWHYLSLLLALITIAGLLWVIVGLLMKMNYIPYFDFGYSWFYAYVMWLLS